MSTRPSWIVNADAVEGVIDRSERLPFRFMFEHGSLQAGVYLLGERDHQTPHNRDEAYIVISGTGTVVVGEERTEFRAGDFIFVPAGAGHRFEEYSSDVALWVVFYGPEGGEAG